MGQILETFIRNMINRLYEAGITNPTQEDITCKYGTEILKFRLYSQDQWDSMVSSQNAAVRLFSEKGISHQPDAVVTHKDNVYLVRLIK